MADILDQNKQRILDNDSGAIADEFLWTTATGKVLINISDPTMPAIDFGTAKQPGIVFN